mmetsp:Transcript_21343/g.34121  ORF Transcript_21343/g.34121 Transcript_21343/m.34121 type:complete len:214 (+) Transcript_21343:644-1285(+)
MLSKFVSGTLMILTIRSRMAAGPGVVSQSAVHHAVLDVLTSEMIFALSPNLSATPKSEERSYLPSTWPSKPSISSSFRKLSNVTIHGDLWSTVALYSDHRLSKPSNKASMSPGCKIGRCPMSRFCLVHRCSRARRWQAWQLAEQKTVMKPGFRRHSPCSACAAHEPDQFSAGRSSQSAIMSRKGCSTSMLSCPGNMRIVRITLSVPASRKRKT